MLEVMALNVIQSNLFPKSILAKLHSTKKNSVKLKTYNQSHIKPLRVSTVKLIHKDECVRCRFFILPGNGPALLEMPDI